MLSTCYQPVDSQLKIYVAKGSELTVRDQEKSYEGRMVTVVPIVPQTIVVPATTVYSSSSNNI